MPSIDIKVENNKLIITAPISSGVRSKSGKTLVVVSTGGFVDVPNSDIRVNLTATKPK